MKSQDFANIDVSWNLLLNEYSSFVIIRAMASQITGGSEIARLFVQAQIKENIKVPRHRPFYGNSDRSIPPTKGQ